MTNYAKNAAMVFHHLLMVTPTLKRRSGLDELAHLYVDTHNLFFPQSLAKMLHILIEKGLIKGVFRQGPTLRVEVSFFRNCSLRVLFF